MGRNGNTGGKATERVIDMGTSAESRAGREKALDMALSQIEKQFGKGSVMRLGQRDVVQRAGGEDEALASICVDDRSVAATLAPARGLEATQKRRRLLATRRRRRGSLL